MGSKQQPNHLLLDLDAKDWNSKKEQVLKQLKENKIKTLKINGSLGKKKVEL